MKAKSKKEPETPFIRYNNYFYLYKKENDRYYLGRPHTKLGWIVKSIKPETFENKCTPLTIEDNMYEGHYFPPANAKDIANWEKLKLKKLKKLVELTKDKSIL